VILSVEKSGVKLPHGASPSRESSNPGNRMIRIHSAIGAKGLTDARWVLHQKMATGLANFQERQEESLKLNHCGEGERERGEREEASVLFDITVLALW
jgi:hypothetical protein